MTRINCVPIEEIPLKMLFAEWREMPRLVGNLKTSLNRKGKPFHTSECPEEYVLGKGHVKFFYNKFEYLHKRHKLITKKLLSLGYNLQNTDSNIFSEVPEEYYNDWNPTQEAMDLNKKRIQERLTGGSL